MYYSYGSFQGPFEVIIKKMENCEETGLKKIDVVYANLTRTGVETYNYAGKIITTIDFGDNVDVSKYYLLPWSIF